MTPGQLAVAIVLWTVAGVGGLVCCLFLIVVNVRARRVLRSWPGFRKGGLLDVTVLCNLLARVTLLLVATDILGIVGLDLGLPPRPARGALIVWMLVAIAVLVFVESVIQVALFLRRSAVARQELLTGIHGALPDEGE